MRVSPAASKTLALLAKIDSYSPYKEISFMPDEKKLVEDLDKAGYLPQEDEVRLLTFNNN